MREKKFTREVCEMRRVYHDKTERPSEIFIILYDSDPLVKFSKEEFVHYSSQNDVNWNNMIENLYHEHSKKITIKMLKRRSIKNC